MRESGLSGFVKRSEAKLTHMHHDPGPRGWWMPWGASIFERETEHASFCYEVPAADRWPLSARLPPSSKWPPFAMYIRWHVTFMFITKLLMNFGGSRIAVRRRRTKYCSRDSFFPWCQRLSCARMRRFISLQAA